MRLQGAALISHLRSEAKKNARNASLAVKREALEKMQSVYSRFKNVSDLEGFGQRLQGYVGIVRSSLTIALYGAPIIVLIACAIRAIFWILF